MKVISCQQGSAAWFAARSGCVTGSKVAAVLNFLKTGKESKERENYKAQIIGELLTGEPAMEGFLSMEMAWGNDQEPYARAAYEVATGRDVDQVGFILHDDIPFFGGSADGLVGADGGIEIKCPKTATHLRWMLADTVPEEHQAQMFTYMALTGRKYFDFVSFDPRLPPRHQLFIKRLERDEKRIAEIEDGVKAFLAEVQEIIAKLERLNPEIIQTTRSVEEFDAELGITDADLPEWARI